MAWEFPSGSIDTKIGITRRSCLLADTTVHLHGQCMSCTTVYERCRYDLEQGLTTVLINKIGGENRYELIPNM